MPSPHNRDGVPPVCSILCGRAGRTADNDVPLRPGGDMSRPQSEAEYLARMVPPSVAALRRRTFLKGVAGTGAAFALPSFLTACGGGDDGDDSTGGEEASGTVSFGSNEAG